MKVKVDNPEGTLQAVKELIYAMWEAVGKTVGNGFLQDKPNATADEVFKRAADHGDYVPQEFTVKKSGMNEIYMDYVFGRCMKTRIKFDLSEGIIEISPDKPAATYQDWDRRFKSAEEIFEKVLQVGYEEA